MNEFIETLKKRRSIRKFRPDMPAKEDLEQIVEAGLFAANGMGKQGTIIVAITNKEVRDRLSAANASFFPVGGEGFDPFYGAPAVLVVLGSKEVGTSLYDGSLTMGNMMLQAHALGLGSCWIHRAKEEFESDFGKELLAQLGITGDYEGIGHLAVGYPAAPAKAAAPRKDNYVYRIDQ